MKKFRVTFDRVSVKSGVKILLGQAESKSISGNKKTSKDEYIPTIHTSTHRETLTLSMVRGKGTGHNPCTSMVASAWTEHLMMLFRSYNNIHLQYYSL